jgi:hypothetical protein
MSANRTLGRRLAKRAAAGEPPQRFRPTIAADTEA